MNKRVLGAASLLLGGLLAGSTAQAQSPIWMLHNHDAPATQNLTVQDLDMPYDSVVWGVSTILGTGAANNQDVFVSTDGGATFNYNTITGPQASQYNLANVSAINGNIAFFSTFNPTGTGATNGRVYKTTDGAQTFQRVTMPSLAFLNFIHFFSPDSGLVMSDPDNQGFQIYRTSDGGTTWTRATGVPQPSTGDFGIVNLFYATGNHLWFITANGEIVYTHDQGNTWAKSASGLSSAGAQVLRRIAFANPQVGIVVGADSAQYARTTDGGATWTQFTPTGTISEYGICGVPLAPTPTLVGVSPLLLNGTGGNTSVSTDGGLSWTVVDTVVKALTEPYFWDGHTGWAGSFTYTSAGAPIGGMWMYTGSPLGPVRQNPVITVLAPTVTLTGANLTNNTLNMGTSAVGTPVTATITITNTGTAPLTITGITTTPASGAFSVSPSTGTTVAPGATLVLTVTFTPTAAGAATGTLTITSNAQNLPSAAISLNATGVLGLAQDAALNALAQIFPNPATAGATTLRLSGTLTLTGAPVTLTDALGRTVLSAAVAAGATEVQLGGNLPAGVYTLRAQTSRGTVARCLVVK